MKLEIKRQEKNKKRFNIFYGGEYLFSVSEYTYFKENLSDGMEVNDINALKIRCNTAEFMNYALNIMSRHIYTKKSLKEKLLIKGCDIDSAEIIIDELTKKNILSDNTYKENFIYESLKYKKNGIKRIKNELYLKGITAQDSDFDYELEEENLKELTKILIEKEKDEKKIINKLITKGYSFSKILNEIKNYKNTDIEYYE